MVRRLDSQALHAAAFLIHENQKIPQLMLLGIEMGIDLLEVLLRYRVSIAYSVF